MMDAELLAAWLEESDEQLELLTQVVARWATETSNRAHATEALRLIHAMEGSAGVLGFDHLLAVTRFLGSESQRVRADPEANPPIQLGGLIGFVQECNDRLRRGEALAPGDSLVEEMRLRRAKRET